MDNAANRPDMNSGSLATLMGKLQWLRDVATAVAKGFKTGAFIYGEGGVGKSYTILEHLKKLDVPYQLHNSRMTGKGLFLTMAAAPDAIHVLEDMERLTADRDAQGVLRSALWSQPGYERRVTWTTAKDGRLEFSFRGGLILISNRPLADLAELKALATRIEVCHLEVSAVEMTALMFDIAGRGYSWGGKLVIAAEECVQVTEFLLNECRAAGCPLDLRLQQKSFQTFLQHEAGECACHWRDLIAASVREAAQHFRHEQNPLPREDKMAQRRKILREILGQTDDAKDQLRCYLDQTSTSRAEFYRRKREIESGEFDEST